MNPFAIAQPTTFEQAGVLLTDRRFALPVLKAGGMDLLDQLKEGLIEPDLLINIKRIGLTPGAGVSHDPATGTLKIEAMTTLTEIAESPLFEKHAPVVTQALSSAATPQVRNVATAAGNLLQRPRCWYFRNEQFNCLKKGGFTCFAVEGENQYHAIFGDGPCHIVHPSNLALALSVCDGRLHMTGGKRDEVALNDFFHMPDRGLREETDLGREEIITHISLRAAPNSGFYAIKEKQSFDWPLVMAAASLIIEDSTIGRARVCAGAVAPIPWRLPDVDEALIGVRLDDDERLRNACTLAVEGAKPLSGNAYKVKLLPVAVRRAVLRAAGRPEMEA